MPVSFFLFCPLYILDFIDCRAQMKPQEDTVDRFVNSLNTQGGHVLETWLPLVVLDDIFIVFLIEPFR